MCVRGAFDFHIFFLQMIVLFSAKLRLNNVTLQQVLKVYKQTPSQQLNRVKASLYLSSNTTKEIQDDRKVILRAQVIKQHEKYLGLPSLVGKNKKNTFKEIKEKLAKKLVGWKERLLPKARKEISIKVVAQAIPTYSMSCFKILDTLCDEMTSLIRNFWWGATEG